MVLPQLRELLWLCWNVRYAITILCERLMIHILVHMDTQCILHDDGWCFFLSNQRTCTLNDLISQQLISSVASFMCPMWCLWSCSFFLLYIGHGLQEWVCSCLLQSRLCKLFYVHVRTSTLTHAQVQGVIYLTSTVISSLLA